MNILFYDSPISRAYLTILKENNVKIKKIIYLSKFKEINLKFIDNFLCYQNFRSNNFHAIKIYKKLKDKYDFSKLLKIFKLKSNFFKIMYNDIEISKHCEEFKIEKFNSFKNLNNIFNYFDSKKKEYVLFTGGGILPKNFFKKKNLKFVHIHPGNIPNVVGADGFIHSYLNKSKLCSTSFIMNKNIDAGSIIKKIFQKKFKLNSPDLNNRELYNFIFAFVDPLLRTQNLLSILKFFSKNYFIEKKNNLKNRKYYTFTKEKELNLFNKNFFIKN